jgi:hypothetical protein
MLDLTNPLDVLETTADQIQSGEIHLDEVVRVLRMELPQVIDDYIRRATEQTLRDALKAVSSENALKYFGAV